MDNNEALRRVQEGGTALFLNAPSGLEFGINQLTWVTSSGFAGMKMIPPGFHFIHWKYLGEQGTVISGPSADRVTVLQENKANTDHLPVLGIFVLIERSQIIIRKWDEYLEDFKQLEENEAILYENGVRGFDFDRKLAPYPDDKHKEWTSLTNFISRKTIKRCAPLYNTVASAKFLHTENEPTKESKKYEEIHNFRFHPIPQRWTPDSTLVGAERSKYFMDKSYLLEYLVQKHFGTWNELFAEFQLSFVAFWLAESYEGFEQWKQFVSTFCSCEHLAQQGSVEYINMIIILRKQLAIVPQDFFVDVISCNNFLVPSLRNLFTIVEDTLLFMSQEDTEFKKNLLKEQHKLMKIAENRFKKSFSINLFDEEDEDAPTVVMFE